ncbi:hypothetical protein ABEG18_00470 [Alsobacter sp. KACC 23698]|uniref:Uncharacterized protein n=1 Tax=Alsobacter sp. KACC 23698 TaxID=3149229 RepID=A0AAU7JFX3_9HYPH
MSSLSEQVLRILSDVWNPLELLSHEAKAHYLTPANRITNVINNGQNEASINMMTYRFEREHGFSGAVSARNSAVRLLLALKPESEPPGPPDDA